MSGFKPTGIPVENLEAIELGLDELEALRLADVEGLYQDAAAERMGVSRPTFGRLLQAARQKVATALTEEHLLVFGGGEVAVAPQVPDQRGRGCQRRRGCGCGGHGGRHGGNGQRNRTRNKGE